MKAMTAARLCEITDGTLYGRGELILTELSTDSRQIEPGMWFVPIAGERFDGHDFIDSALEKGAVGCFCTKLPAKLREDKAYIQVTDTKVAMRELAAWHREQFTLPVVQITGSMGKTTYKEMLAGTLAQRYNTLKTQGNFNGDIGTPLLILSLAEEHEAAVVETGMDALGQIRAHFIFNLLNAISGMCKYDPAKADETIVRFARYLRAKIDILQNDGPVPFSQVLENLQLQKVLQ